MTIKLENLDFSSDITEVFCNNSYVRFTKIDESIGEVGSETDIQMIYIEYDNKEISNIIGLEYNGFRIDTTDNTLIGKTLTDSNRAYCTLEVL